MFKNLIKFTFNYTVANIIAKLTNFLFLPLFTFYLAPDDFGTYTLISAYTIIITIFIDSGVQFFFQSKTFNSDFDTTLNKSVTFLSLNSLLSFTIFVFLTPLFAKLIFPDKNLSLIIILSLIGFVLESLTNFGTLVLKTTQQIKKLYASSLISFLSQLILLPIFIIFLKLNYISIFITQIISCLLVIVYLANKIKFNFSIKTNFADYKNFLIYIAPILLTNLLTLSIDLIDRFILNFYVDKAEIGVYSFSYKFANIIKIIAFSFLPAWLSTIIDKKDQPNYKKIIETNFYKVTFIFLSLAFLLYILTQFLFDLKILNKSYLVDSSLYLILNVSYAIYGIINFLYFYPYSTENPKLILYSDILGFVTNLFLNLALIPSLGILGAAISTLVSYLSVSIYLYQNIAKNFYGFIDINKLILIITIFISCSVLIFIYSSIILNILIFITLLLFLIIIYYFN